MGGGSKNRGTPKWMVKIMENLIKMDDLGVPLFLETPIYSKKPLFFVICFSSVEISCNGFFGFRVCWCRWICNSICFEMERSRSICQVKSARYLFERRSGRSRKIRWRIDLDTATWFCFRYPGWVFWRWGLVGGMLWLFVKRVQGDESHAKPCIWYI